MKDNLMKNDSVFIKFLDILKMVIVCLMVVIKFLDVL